jgi:phosphoribosylglycinamide formyltransferase 2
MSSSGKGQSVIKEEFDIQKSWTYAMEGSRGDYKEVIIEEFIKFNSEITLLTVTQQNGRTLFCPPIGHRQERGDYQESWQPCSISDGDLNEAQQMAEKVTIALGGYGIWGIEFFLTDKGVYFSELSPRPHDTGMVTLANTQNYNEFELHARAILGFPIPKIELEKNGASAVVLAKKEGGRPNFFGIADVLKNDNTDVKIFNKPSTRPFRRMAVVLCSDHPGTDITKTKEKAVALAKQITLQ